MLDDDRLTGGLLEPGPGLFVQAARRPEAALFLESRKRPPIVLAFLAVDEAGVEGRPIEQDLQLDEQWLLGLSTGEVGGIDRLRLWRESLVTRPCISGRCDKRDRHNQCESRSHANPDVRPNEN